MSLDNTISTPLFQQLAATLRAAIDAGEYPPGSRLPTENELCERYSVSRVTVRKACLLYTSFGLQLLQSDRRFCPLQ